MSPRPSAPGRPLLFAAGGAACISSSAILVQLAGVGAATTAFFRCCLALPFIGLVAVLEQRRQGRRMPSQRWKTAAAGFAFAVDLVLWTHAIAAVGAGVATVLGNLQVLFVAATAWVVFRERPSSRLLVALPIVGLGVVLVAGIVGGSSYGRHPVAGIIYGVGTSIAYAVFLLALRSLSSGSPHVAGPLFDATAGAAVSALAIGLVFGSLQFTLSWRSFGWLLVLAILSQTLGWLLITSSLPRLPAAVSSLMLLLQPAAAVLLAAVVLGQHPTAWQLLGAGLVCCGVLVAARRASATTLDLLTSPTGEPSTT